MIKYHDSTVILLSIKSVNMKSQPSLFVCLFFNKFLGSKLALVSAEVLYVSTQRIPVRARLRPCGLPQDGCLSQSSGSVPVAPRTTRPTPSRPCAAHGNSEAAFTLPLALIPFPTTLMWLQRALTAREATGINCEGSYSTGAKSTLGLMLHFPPENIS